MAGTSVARPCTLHHHHHHYSLPFNLSLSVPSLKSQYFRPQSCLHYNNNNTSTSNSNSNSNSKASYEKSLHTSKNPVASKTSDNDPELRAVLEIATHSELFHIHTILFGPSYLSPLLKSISKGAEFDPFMIEQDFEERDHFIQALESRFLYLAADARSTLRGWRPSYRNVLLDVRKELKVPCSTKLSTEDLEGEIFIHLLGECSRDQDNAAIKVGTAELCSVILKGGQLLSLLKISELVTKRLSGTMVLEAAKHKLDREVLKKGVTGAASKFFGFRSLATFIGPMVWGTFLADVVIQMLGTDYIRILQAICAFAQIRILRRHGLRLDILRAGS